MYYKFGLKHYYYNFYVYFNKYYYLLKKRKSGPFTLQIRDSQNI